ncbi:MAG: hypothetical protein U0354_20875 [Candidatus Sericytochromatia bacterium]
MNKTKKLVNFLVWNIANNKNIEPILINLIKKNKSDIVVLIEPDFNLNLFLTNLNKLTKKKYEISKSLMPNNKITLISNFNNLELTSNQDFNERMTVRKLNIKGYKEIIIACVHLISKLNVNNSTQAFEATRYSNEISNAEVFAGHERTIVVGDFNMNPFEEGIMSAIAFNAVMSREVAKKRIRKVQGREYKYFYNPMWHFFGDIDKTPLGTFYFQSPDHVNYSWNIFDQVLIRPELIDCVKYNKLKILDSDGVTTLLKNGKPDKNSYSDHLPISFTINLGEIK